MSLSQIIVRWYTQNKRDLPWRNTRDPYFIWLSEIILQQTRVNQGLAYYYRFVETYPTVSALAEAPEEEILKLWQGLGYYSRARNMHASAKEINKSGKFPASFSEIIKLKGIGNYTAAAIASFAFDEPVAVVDGNVFRVLSRYLGLELPIDSTEGKKVFSATANEVLDKAAPALHNQAIMEFGALQCKPASPDCSVCPLISGCYAYQNKKVAVLPVKGKKLKPRDRYFNYLVINHQGKLLLNKRSGKDIWKNLYDFPLIESTSFISREELSSSEAFKEIVKQKAFTIKESGSFTHQLSHQTLHARFWEINVKQAYALKETAFEIVEEEDLSKYAVPRLIEKYLEEKQNSRF